MTDTSVADTSPAGERVRSQVEDALELANYVISTGVRDASGQLLPPSDIAIIQGTASLLGIIDVKQDTPGPAGATAGSITISQWIAFEQAYYRLASTLSPITAETLRNTRDVSRSPEGGVFRRVLSRFSDCSPAQHFNRRLWAFTITFAIFVVLAEWGSGVLGSRTNANDLWIKGPRDFLQSLLPWAYGGLGACAYMLRSAHYFIYQRSFDVRRTPEYFNRIGLGAISGGAIILFVNNLMNDDGSSINLGSAALGFVAGYSTDFLFNTIERIVTAIFPKVAVETVAADSSMARTAPRRRVPDSKPDPAAPADGEAADDKSQARPRGRPATSTTVTGSGTPSGGTSA
jgi:hypothetical protein